MAAVLTTGVAQAQTVMRVVPPGIVVASDIDGPYDDVVPPVPGTPLYAPRIYRQQGYGPPGYGPAPYGPSTYTPPALPIHEIYRIVRDGGYSPLGAPQQRGPVYTIAVIDLNGEDGRLVIDARNGRIIRFVPAYRDGARSMEDVNVAYGPPGAPPPIATVSPPLSMRAPGVTMQARASVPVPKPRTNAAPPLSEKSSAVGVRQPNAQAPIPPAPTAALAAAPAVVAPTPPLAVKPSVTLQPTQAMPPAQGVD